MSLEFYKVLHILGLSLLLLGLGVGATYFALAKAGAAKSLKIVAFSFHGLGLALMLVSGFGMLAKLGFLTEMPSWVYGKLTIWVVFALMISVIKRKPGWLHLSLAFMIFLVALAASLAIHRGF